VIGKRVYFFDKHISDVALRLILTLIFIPALSVTWFIISDFDTVFEGLFGDPILGEIQLTLDKSRLQALGQVDLFTAIESKREKDEKGVIDYPRYLKEFGVPSDDPDITAIQLLIFYHRIATWTIAGILCLISLALFYLIITSYSTGKSNWKIQQAVFQFFNNDLKKIAPKCEITELPLLHRLIFDISFTRAISSDVGEFLFVDKEYYALLYPGGKIEDDKLTELSAAFMEMCTKIFRYKIQKEKANKAFDYCLLNPLKGKTTLTNVTKDGINYSFFKAGVFRIVPPLFTALKDSCKYLKTISPEVYAIERTGHPFSYKLFTTIVKYRTAIEEGKSKDLIYDGSLAIKLPRLLEESNIPIPEDDLRDFIADIHDDIAHLVNKKAIDSWKVLDNGIPLALDWYEAIRSFSFSPDDNEFKRGIELLSSKVYCFDVELPESATGQNIATRRLPAST